MNVRGKKSIKVKHSGGKIKVRGRIWKGKKLLVKKRKEMRRHKDRRKDNRKKK